MTVRAILLGSLVGAGAYIGVYYLVAWAVQ